MSVSPSLNPDASPDLLEDEQRRLLFALRRGDEAAFGLVLDLFNPTLTHLAHVYATDGSAIDELVDATWQALLDELDSLDGALSLQDWLCQRLSQLAGRPSSELDVPAEAPTSLQAVTRSATRARQLARFRAWKAR